MKLINIEARDLPDAWFQSIYACLDHGTKHQINFGSYEGQQRLELDYITIHVKDPGFPHDRQSIDDLLPKLPAHYNVPDPVCEGYLDDYLPYIMTDKISENETYTYGSRLWKASMLEFIENNTLHNVFLDQVNYVIQSYKNKGHRSNQMVLQIAQPFDLTCSDPPCLRHIDTRIQDNKLHFFIYFRSWDLWNGMPANLSAIQFLKEYMAYEIGVEDGEMICSSKGLHLYDHVWDIAKRLKGDSL